MSGRRAVDPSGGPACPAPLRNRPSVLLAHGGGGSLSQELIESVFLDAFRNPALEALHDGALLEVDRARIAFTTDSYVVRPLFFPGGDIGSLAVHGTVNDLAMCGAMPVGLSAGFILEEGLAMADLLRITGSMAAAARAADVPIVTGDTKVVDRGKGDGVFINTAGLGVRLPEAEISPSRAGPGDVVIVSGSIGLHGVAILSVREGLGFESSIRSDSAALHGLVRSALAAAGRDLHVLRDPTRGGVASALNEIAVQAKVGILLDERSIPLRDDVRAACEILGLDPLYVANEGKCLAIVARERADAVVAAMRADSNGAEAAVIGEVVAAHPGRVVIRSGIGGTRFVDRLTGEQLPRIC